MTSHRLRVAMLAAGLATFALLYATQPILPQLAQDFRLNEAQASLAISLTTGPLAFGLVAAGLLSDRLGRRGVMIASLFAASILTCASAIVSSWGFLLASRLLIGLALAGVPSVAMAYVAEEAGAGAIATVMGLYVSGTTIGGMAGRVGVSVVADHFGWQAGLAAIGGAGLLAALIFCWAAPPSRGFTARHHDWQSVAAAIGRLRRDAAMRWLYAEAFLLMGGFVTLYNYAGFHLQEAPYDLSPSAVGALFLIYLVGTASSAWFGRLASRRGTATIFPIPTLLFLAGILLTLVPGLVAFVIGLALATGGFFGAHSIASSWVSHRAGADRATAASFYLFFYYMGSSVLGSVGGLAWGQAGWHGIVAYAGLLVILGLLISGYLRHVERPTVAERA
ncbi:MFS transporter [Sphingomonas abietis]|uniref:MFS transporter n=1 Tax=Sphingomonas abietis TaxID=3012344 RepID=A0ABY7NIZ0_9SPHN|nr:MFS transporter [Sphingomonas abietis]WBO21288.1 MFS transporter [Sphingomonas abietis]